MVTITDTNFETVMQQASRPLLVDIWASWCGPCRAMEPVLEQVASEVEGKAVVAKLSAEDYPKLAEQLGVRSLPTFMVFKGGQPVQAFHGITRQDILLQALRQAGA